MCSKAYPNFTTETQLSLAVDQFLAGFADATSRDYHLHDRACRALTWQETVQMAQAGEGSRLLLPYSSVTAASATVGSRSFVDDDTSTCSVRAPSQKSSSRAGRVNESAHSSRTSKQHVTDDYARSQKSKGPSPSQTNANSSGAPRYPPPYSNIPRAENVTASYSEPPKFSSKLFTPTCFKCGKLEHMLSVCSVDPKSVRKCFGCGVVGHMARNCPTRLAQSAPKLNSSSSANAVASAGKSAP